MSNINQLFLQKLPSCIFGGDGENDDASNSSSEELGSESSQNGSESTGSASNDLGDATPNDSKSDDDTRGLKSALNTEREARKAAERELKKFQKAHDDAELAKKDEVTQAATRAERAESKVAKLASGLLNQRLADAIRKAAGDFTDPEDAVSGVDRSQLVYEQDDDDPSEITIDAKSVQNAVKRLATAKPHWLKTGTSDGEPTGSSFGNPRKPTPKTSDDALRENYPALRH